MVEGDFDGELRPYIRRTYAEPSTQQQSTASVSGVY
jgi:hypothetical protein